MGSDMSNILVTLLVIGAGLTAFILGVVFIALPLFKGLAYLIGYTVGGIGWVFMHIFEYIGGTLSDIIRFVGSLLAMVVLLPLVPLNIVIGRWSAAGHFAEGVKRECQVGSACVYRAVLRRPLKFLLLDGVLEGLEQRVPEAMAHVPGADSPSRRTGQFDGYAIVGSLPVGGSGAKLYIAEPSVEKRRRIEGNALKCIAPAQVVIKSFALTEGSSLPQIVRESRALECAKQLGHVLDHGMDDHRFFYVMPYHAGDHLGILTRQMHAECGSAGTGTRGLDRKRFDLVMTYTRDLLATLASYHKGGLWHKDVKPENVIVHDGRAHLVDLGLVTPLRSAMTLTTHGTEYFRDPEMVRQALRGVKVHQVDGAKFDLYAVGAVLYFMIENTFPAHGGLSRITRPAPEALRWIVRRGMTDYNQRYASANEMLADVEFVMRARDPFEVKPAELPSMRGVGVVEQYAELAHDEVGTPAFSAQPPAGQRAAAPAAPMYAGAAAGAGGAAPKIVVTNWWTGEYRVEQPSPAGVAVGAQGDREAASEFRAQAASLRAQAAKLRHDVQAGTISARRAAKEQLRSARQRAKEIRSRALTHRSRVVSSHRRATSPWAVLIGILSVLFLGSIIAGSILVNAGSRARFAGVATSSTPGMPVLLVVDGGDMSNPRVRARVQSIVEERAAQGYDVVIDEYGSQSEIRYLLHEWYDNPKGAADSAIEDVLAAHNLYGLMHVTIEGDARRPLKKVNSTIIHSTRSGASERRRTIVAPLQMIEPAPELPYLFINDHPAKAEIEVAARIEGLLKAYRAQGWLIASDDDAEVNVRRFLPAGPVDRASLTPMFDAALAERGFGGVLRVDSGSGEGKPSERVEMMRFDARQPAEMEQAAEAKRQAEEQAEQAAEAEAAAASAEAERPAEQQPNGSEGARAGSRDAVTCVARALAAVEVELKGLFR